MATRGKYLRALATVLLSCAGPAFSQVYADLLWSVSDDTLTTPIGAVGDAAADAAGVVYLLDRQVATVRRIAPGGVELPPLGRHGEGPGEFVFPLLVAAHPNGGCTVVQDFAAPSVCLGPGGDICPGPDLSLIRRRFITTTFMGTARMDGEGRLLVSATTDARGYEPGMRVAELGTAWSVFRIDPDRNEMVVLFSDRDDACGPSTVKVALFLGHYVLRCWDVDASGRVIYADPSGAYGVIIGHAADGESRVLALSEQPEDKEGMQRVAKMKGRPVGELGRIGDVQWLDHDHFVVSPVAAMRGPRLEQGGVFELFDTEGRSFGRQDLGLDLDPETDWFFLRGPVAVVVRGGQSAMRASLGMAGAKGKDSNAIIVSAYALRDR